MNHDLKADAPRECVKRICRKYGIPFPKALRHRKLMRAAQNKNKPIQTVSVPDIDIDIYANVNVARDTEDPLKYVKAFLLRRREIGLDIADRGYNAVDVLNHIRKSKTHTL